METATIIKPETFDFDSIVVAEPVRTIEPAIEPSTDSRPVYGPREFGELSFEEQQAYMPKFDMYSDFGRVAINSED